MDLYTKRKVRTWIMKIRNVMKVERKKKVRTRAQRLGYVGIKKQSIIIFKLETYYILL